MSANTVGDVYILDLCEVGLPSWAGTRRTVEHQVFLFEIGETYGSGVNASATLLSPGYPQRFREIATAYLELSISNPDAELLAWTVTDDLDASVVAHGTVDTTEALIRVPFVATADGTHQLTLNLGALPPIVGPIFYVVPWTDTYTA